MRKLRSHRLRSAHRSIISNVQHIGSIIDSRTFTSHDEVQQSRVDRITWMLSNIEADIELLSQPELTEDETYTYLYHPNHIAEMIQLIGRMRRFYDIIIQLIPNVIRNSRESKMIYEAVNGFARQYPRSLDNDKKERIVKLSIGMIYGQFTQYWNQWHRYEKIPNMKQLVYHLQYCHHLSLKLAAQNSI